MATDLLAVADALAANYLLVTVPTGERRAETSVEGPVDSLPTLVDRLAAKLLQELARFACGFA